MAIFRRPMHPARMQLARVFLVLGALSFVFVSTGCEEFNARRKIQQAGKKYEKGLYEESVALYEEALEIEPSLKVGHHNAGLAYRQLFLRAQADPEAAQEQVQDYANKAAEHFQKYLETDPDDGAVIGLMTKLWLDSGQYPKAIAFWEQRLAKDPTSTEVLGILAGINRQAGNWDASVGFFQKQAEAEKTADSKATALSNVAKMAYHRLRDREKIVGMERLRVADIGIAALQQATRLDISLKMSVEVQTYMSSLYNSRALAHGASFGRLADQASADYHRSEFMTLNEKLKKQEEAEIGLPAKKDEG